jgi:hypothetical protein
VPPRFSVLLPTHNRADVLGYAIRSVLWQTEQDFELLVVADGCTDLTRDVVQGFADPRIRFFDLPKAPYFGYANRNIALRTAQGRYIAFAAHDDLLFPDHLTQMGALLDRTGADWGYSRPTWVSTDGVMVPFGTNLELSDELVAFCTRENTIPASCVVHTRSILGAVGYWPDDVPVAADWILWRRMLAVSERPPAVLPVPTALHFSAMWKQSRHSRSEAVRLFLEVADTVEWWPSVLTVECRHDTQQAGFFHLMQAGGATWITQVRHALSAVLERVGWASVYSVGRTDVPLLQLARRERRLRNSRLWPVMSTLWAVIRMTRRASAAWRKPRGGTRR